jgi:hypothetical protein
VPNPGYLYDDAYITLASAEALRAGIDPTFHGTPPLVGITSPVHCVLVSVLLTVLEPEWALLTSCLLGTVLYGAGLWTLGRGEGLGATERAAAVICGLGAGMISQHLVNGLETSLALAACTWLVAASRRGDPTLLGVVAGTAPWVRPELAVPALLLCSWHVWQHPTSWVRLGGSAAAASSPWALLLFLHTGSLVPSTLEAKRAWYAEGCWPVGRRAKVVIEGLGGWLAPMPIVAAGASGLLRGASGRILLGSALLALTVWAFSVPNVLHAYQRHRYYAVFLPMLVFGLMQLPRWARPVALYGATGFALLSIAGVVRFEPGAISRAMQVRAGVHRALSGHDVQRLLLHDAGYIAFARAVPAAIDMVGLKSPLAAELHGALTDPSCGEARGEAIGRLAEATRPTHLIIWEPWDEHFGITAALRQAGWTVNRVESISAPEPLHLYSLSHVR